MMIKPIESNVAELARTSLAKTHRACHTEIRQRLRLSVPLCYLGTLCSVEWEWQRLGSSRTEVAQALYL